MKRTMSKGIALTVLAVFAMTGEAAAFTPVPIPIPRAGTAVVAHIAHDRAQAVDRLKK
ncbi:MAG: hypothetical protein JO325_13460 [Solirubrobacterales bacterium]|nr:hypothetical protein [Solirubrobacterales bacterium]